MGFFFKDRHGTISTTRPGRQFIWSIPKIIQYTDTILDSHNVESFSGAEFHFHMKISPQRDIGFYVHYKAPPIPKYSYYLAAAVAEPRQCTSTWIHPPAVHPQRTTRQFTAHTIPPETERCGHWNIINFEELSAMLEGTDGTLLVVFEFDEDTVTVKEKGNETHILWSIPRFRYRMCRPFTSRGFAINDNVLAIRLDQRGEDYVCFVFSKTNTMPSHSMSISTGGCELLAKADRKPDGDQSTHTLIVKQEDIMKTVLMNTTIIVELVLHRAVNPLEQLNSQFSIPSKRATAKQSTAHYTKVGKSDYLVVTDDL